MYGRVRHLTNSVVASTASAWVSPTITYRSVDDATTALVYLLCKGRLLVERATGGHPSPGKSGNSLEDVLVHSADVNARARRLDGSRR